MATTKINHPDLLELDSSTGATAFPKGTTGERPVSPVAGYIRFNTTEVVMETYDGTEWLTLDTIIPTYAVDYLVVAGGGGGGQYIGGGAGAGGLRTSYGTTSGGGVASEASSNLNPATSYVITIGAGGVGGLSPSRIATDGQSSSFNNIVSIGGGGGGQTVNGTNGDSQSGAPGGSGGGSSYWSGVTRYVGAGTTGQGYAGGNGNTSGSLFGGGGGGAGSVGSSNGVGGCTPTPGGNGLAVAITGSLITYAAGGNGGGNGNGCTLAPYGGPNTGAGGGGSFQGETGGGYGRSGVVILRMLTANYSGTTTGAPTVTIDGSDTILIYTSSGTYTA